MSQSGVGCVLLVVQVQRGDPRADQDASRSHLMTREMKEDETGVAGRSDSWFKDPGIREPDVCQEWEKFAGESPSPLKWPRGRIRE